MSLLHALIEPSALHFILPHDDVVVLDGSYGVSGGQGSPQDFWRGMRIGNAQFFDIDKVADPLSLLPHMLPSPDEFAAAVSAMGISNTNRVVVYDQTGLSMAAARVWWMLRIFGHENVAVLNGGLPAWRAAGLPVISTPPPPPEKTGHFTPRFRPELVRSKADVMEALAHPEKLIVDARAADRFTGAMAEPRGGLRAGHIPGSTNLPFVNLIDPVTGRMRTEDQLEPDLQAIAGHPEIISTCGSGVTACVLALALHSMGRTDVAVYDGSWVEWGAADAGTPVDSGPAKV